MEDFYMSNVHQKSLKIWQILKKNSCAGNCLGQKCDTTSYMPNEVPREQVFPAAGKQNAPTAKLQNTELSKRRNPSWRLPAR